VGTLTLDGGGEGTVTVAELTTGGPPLLAVAVYVVVTGGFTVSGDEAELLTATGPIPLSMVTEVALVEVQVSVQYPPDGIETGVAVNVIVGAPRAGGFTVTVAELTTCVPPLLAVAVYVVVAEGVTVTGVEAELLRATDPIPLLIVTEVALLEVHVRVTVVPAVTDEGCAVSAIVGAAVEGSLEVVEELLLDGTPPHPANAIRTASIARIDDLLNTRGSTTCNSAMLALESGILNRVAQQLWRTHVSLFVTSELNYVCELN
jgi:hypothetical protein